MDKGIKVLSAGLLLLALGFAAGCHPQPPVYPEQPSGLELNCEDPTTNWEVDACWGPQGGPRG